MKEKKKLSLAMQIFIALVRHDFSQSAEVYRRANCTVFDYERYYFDV